MEIGLVLCMSDSTLFMYISIYTLMYIANVVYTLYQYIYINNSLILTNIFLRDMKFNMWIFWISRVLWMSIVLKFFPANLSVSSYCEWANLIKSS